MGSQRRLEMFDENAPTHGEEDHIEMTTTASRRLDYQNGFVIRYFDAVLQKETTNQTAKTDLIVDGVVIAKAVPTTFLLGLETKLKELRATYDDIPTLAPGIKWEKDALKGNDVYQTANPEIRFKTEKIFKVQVLYDATKEHPAQVEKIPETKDVGRYTRTIWSGMMSPAEKSRLLGRIDTLLRAVKKARQRANSTDVVKTTIGQKLFEYING